MIGNTFSVENVCYAEISMDLIDEIVSRSVGIFDFAESWGAELFETNGICIKGT